MKHFRVKRNVISCEGLNKKTFKANESVKAGDFAEGRLKVLIEKGFVEEFTPEKEADTQAEAAEVVGSTEAADADEADEVAEADEVLHDAAEAVAKTQFYNDQKYSEMKVGEIRDELKSLKIDFETTDRKLDLWKLLPVI